VASAADALNTVFLSTMINRIGWGWRPAVHQGETWGCTAPWVDRK